ncbi:MAG: hypothetical protein ACK5MH_06465 [Bacteroidales bacterium]
MNEIRDVNQSCQVQPNDFSFLSKADFLLVTAFVGLVKNAFGLSDATNPIVISGLEVVSTPAGSGITIDISEGILLYKGKMYHVEGIAGLSFINQQAFLSTAKLRLPDAIVCEPSPVYDENLAKTINRHYKYEGYIEVGAPAGDNVFSFNSTIQRIPLIG